MPFDRNRRIKGRCHADFPQSHSQELAVNRIYTLAAGLLHPPLNRDDCLILRHPLAEGDSAMKQWTKSLGLWLGSAAILTTLLLAAPVAAQNGQGGSGQGQNGQGGGTWIPSPEPATLTLLALGGGAAALVRYRKSRRGK